MNGVNPALNNYGYRNFQGKGQGGYFTSKSVGITPDTLSMYNLKVKKLWLVARIKRYA